MEEKKDVRSQVEDDMLDALEDLKLYEPGSKEHQGKLEELSTLGEIRIAEFKAEADQYNAETKAQLDAAKLEVETEKQKNENKRFWISTGIGCATTYVGWRMWKNQIVRVLEIEKTGVVTTKAFQLLSRFRLFK